VNQVSLPVFLKACDAVAQVSCSFIVFGTNRSLQRRAQVLNAIGRFVYLVLSLDVGILGGACRSG
jgi:hypothetical protein